MRNIMFLFCLSIVGSLAAQDWQANYAEAQDLAKKNNKKLVLVFAGSDWCAPCIKLEKTVWESNDFKEFAKSELVLYRADFPRKKENKLPGKIAEENNQLAEKYNPQGHFPLVVLLDENLNVLGETGYLKLTPQGYVDHLKTFFK